MLPFSAQRTMRKPGQKVCEVQRRWVTPRQQDIENMKGLKLMATHRDCGDKCQTCTGSSWMGCQGCEGEVDTELPLLTKKSLPLTSGCNGKVNLLQQSLIGKMTNTKGTQWQFCRFFWIHITLFGHFLLSFGSFWSFACTQWFLLFYFKVLFDFCFFVVCLFVYVFLLFLFIYLFLFLCVFCLFDI